jgi:drug/metabolite transporter (DMT)-like permease
MDAAVSPARARLLPLAALLTGNVALAMGPWFVRLADTGPVSAGFWRVALALPVIALLARANRQPLTGIPRGVVAAVLLGGVLFGLDIASWHIGIGMTRLANATVFGNAGSLILMVWGFIAWRRLPKGREWPSLVAALTGAAILMGRSFEISPQTLYGDLFCLLAGILYAGYLLILQDARRTLGNWSLLAW